MLFKNYALGLASLAAVAQARISAPVWPLVAEQISNGQISEGQVSEGQISHRQLAQGPNVEQMMCQPGALPGAFLGGNINFAVIARVAIRRIPISSFFPSNTVISPAEGVTVTVTNAPTVINTVFTATVTQTPAAGVTVTVTNAPTVIQTVFTATGTQTPAAGVTVSLTATQTETVTITETVTGDGAIGTTSELFVLSVNFFAAPARKRALIGRQGSSATFLESNAEYDAHYTEAAVFRLDDGQLFSNDLTFVANEGVVFARLEFLRAGDDGVRQFTLDSGNLVLRHEDFNGTEAVFCVPDFDDHIYVAFDGVYPDNCKALRLGHAPPPGSTPTTTATSAATTAPGTTCPAPRTVTVTASAPSTPSVPASPLVPGQFPRGSTPEFIGTAILIGPPITAEVNINFQFPAPEVGSIGRTSNEAACDPRQRFAFYRIDGVPDKVNNHNTIGYFYHINSGLCVQASPGQDAYPIYRGGKVTLQVCDVSGTTPPIPQLWAATRPTGPGGMGPVLIGFQGDLISGPAYSSSTGEGEERLDTGAGKPAWVYIT